jgi:TRAP-type transport system periplasmic protein
MWRLMAAGMVCAAFAAPAASAKEVKFTFATTNGSQDLSSRSIVLWKDLLEKKSGGSIKMEFSPDSLLGGDQQLLQQLATNEIQMHIAGPVIVHQLAKEYQCLEAEYVFKDEAHGMKVWSGPLGKEVSDFVKKKYGIEIVVVAPRGARHMTANKPIREPADMKGVKVRVTNNLRGQVFAAYGALPGPLSMSELYGALRQGVFDAQENPISTIYGARLYEVQSHISLTSHVWSYNVVSANSSFLQSLSAEQRAIFDETLKEAMAWLKHAVATETDELAAKMKQQSKVEIIDANVAAFRDIALPIVEAFAAKNCRPGLLDQIRQAAD